MIIVIKIIIIIILDNKLEHVGTHHSKFDNLLLIFGSSKPLSNSRPHTWIKEN